MISRRPPCSSVSEAAFVAAEGPALELGFVPGRVAWWTEVRSRVVARFETGTTLPEGSEFATLTMMTGDQAPPSLWCWFPELRMLRDV